MGVYLLGLLALLMAAIRISRSHHVELLLIPLHACIRTLLPVGVLDLAMTVWSICDNAKSLKYYLVCLFNIRFW